MATGNLTNEFLNTVARARTERNSLLLSNCLLLVPSIIRQNYLMTSLRNELIAGTSMNSSFIEKKCNEVLGDEWIGFTDMLMGYLNYLRDLDPTVMEQENPQRMNDWLLSLSALLGQITPAWSSPQGILLLPFIKESTNVLSSLAIRIDTLTGNPRKPAANEASRLILRAFNIALGDRAGQGQLGKKEAAFHLANVLFKLYFKLDQIRLCPTIHKNLAQASLPSMLSTHFPKAQQCTYNYYLGRHSLYSASESAASLIPAFTALSTAYSLCPAVCPSQLRQILIYLIVAGILVGKMPNEGVWHRAEAYGLREIFYPIGQCVRKGDFRGFRNELRRNGDWLKKKGLYLILWSGCEDLLWRSLARKCFLLTQPPSNPYLLQQQKQQGIKSPPPMLSVQHLCILANYLHQPEPWGSRRASVLFSEGETFTMDDIEGVILNLLDQGLIKGYIARGKMVVVLKRGDGQGFVSVEEARRWKAASRGSLNGGDDEWSGTTNGNGAKASGGGVVRLSGLRTIGT